MSEMTENRAAGGRSREMIFLKKVLDIKSKI
jgi:hypothetical protein